MDIASVIVLTMDIASVIILSGYGPVSNVKVIRESFN